MKTDNHSETSRTLLQPALLFTLLCAASLLGQVTSTAQSPPGPIVWPLQAKATSVQVCGYVINGITSDTLNCGQVIWSDPESAAERGKAATDPATRRFTIELPLDQTVDLYCRLEGFTSRHYKLSPPAGDSHAVLEQNILVFPTKVALEKEMIAKDVVSVFNDPVKLSDTEWEIAIDIKKYLTDSLAFFITGYYRYNVSSGLPKLQLLIDNHPRELGYMRITAQDIRSSLVIDNLMSAIFSNSHQLFGKLADDPSLKKLSIDIVGYADDRTLNAVYVEDTIHYTNPDNHFPQKEILINKGENIDNIKLSQLRAYCTMQGLQELFSRSEFYRELQKTGKLEYRVFGAGVSEVINRNQLSESELNKKYAEARRATITLRGEYYTK